MIFQECHNATVRFPVVKSLVVVIQELCFPNMEISTLWSLFDIILKNR